MNVTFRSVERTPDEITMGHALWFHPIPKCDGISSTANTNGFTPLRAIERAFAWKRSVIDSAAESCNAEGEVCLLPFSPKLLLVPATKGHGDAEFLIRDLMAASRSAGIRSLHFTHFGFLQGRLPLNEVTAIRNYLFGNITTLGLGSIVIDIDARVEANFFRTMIPIGAQNGGETLAPPPP